MRRFPHRFRPRQLLLFVLGFVLFLLCWLLLTILILLAQDFFGFAPPLFLSSNVRSSAVPFPVDSDSFAGNGIQLLVGHFNGNLPDAKRSSAVNLSLEETNANGWAPREGAGEGGRAVALTGKEQRQAQRTFGINQFNLMASDRMSLSRSLPDIRRRQCREKQYPPADKLPNTSGN